MKQANLRQTDYVATEETSVHPDRLIDEKVVAKGRMSLSEVKSLLEKL